MKVIVQNEDMIVHDNVDKAYLSDSNEVVIEKEDNIIRSNGEIINIDEAKVVSISNYYGSEISEIDPSDIHSVENDVASFYCNSAMVTANRVTLDLLSNSVEINGEIVRSFDSI